MADRGKFFTIREEESIGGVKISEEVIAIIAGLAATEVQGVSALEGGATKDKIAKLGIKKLRPGIRAEVLNGVVTVDVTIQIDFGYSIVDVGTQVLGVIVIGLTGEGGGTLAREADIAIRVPERETFKVQELHLPVYHYLCAAVEAYFFEA